MAVGGSFRDDVVVQPVGEGRYEARLEEWWNLRPLPQGGVVSALALRAMADVLGDPEQRLRTLHTTFVGQVAHGDLEIEVDLLRRGRSMSHLRASVQNVGATSGHVTTAVFGRPRWGFTFEDAAPPEVEPPEACPSFRDPPPPDWPRWDPMPFWEQLIEGRAAMGHAPWEDYEPETSDNAMWYRFDDPPFLDDGTLDPLALVVMADTMPGAVGEKIGRSEHSWFGPSVDLTVHLLAPCRSEWVLAHNRARHAGDGYASAEMTLWDMGGDQPRQVAYATQVVFFTRFDPPS